MPIGHSVAQSYKHILYNQINPLKPSGRYMYHLL
jgi:hypothetical protein